MFDHILSLAILVILCLAQRPDKSCGPFGLTWHNSAGDTPISSLLDGTLTVEQNNATTHGHYLLPRVPINDTATDFYIFENGSLAISSGAFCHAYPHFRCFPGPADNSSVSIAANGTLVYNNNAFWYLIQIVDGLMANGTAEKLSYYISSGYYGVPDAASIGVTDQQKGGYAKMNITASGCWEGHAVNGTTAPTPTGSGAVLSPGANSGNIKAQSSMDGMTVILLVGSLASTLFM